MNNQVAVVTGAASGMGRQLVVDLARAGTAVAAFDMSESGLAALQNELSGCSVSCHPTDVCNADGMAAAVDEAERKLGPIDLVIACAGINVPPTKLNLRAADLQKILTVNIIGVANTFAPALERMLPRRRGHLAAISSMASLRGLPYMLPYSASKAGLNAWMDGLRVELRGSGLGLTTICPGWIDTAMNASIKDTKPGMVPQTEASRRILEAIRRNKRFYAFPAHTAWQMYLLKWLPASLQDAILARMFGEPPPSQAG